MTHYSFEEVEAWLKEHRERWNDDTKGFHDIQSPYWSYDHLLDELRLHWATGTPLDREAKEGRE